MHDTAMPSTIARSMRLLIIVAVATGCSGSPAHLPPGTARPSPATPQPSRAALPDSAVWRVVSYNIRHGRGMDDRVDLERTADVIRRLDPDIVALQEVDNQVERSGSVDQAARLGELLDMYHAFGSFMDYQGGRYGMAILSRCPILSAESVRLTEGNEPRIALGVDIAQPDGSVLSIVNVHFDWVATDTFRIRQAMETAQYLDAKNSPWILAGDFNDRAGSRTLELFRQRGHETEKPADRQFTFPSTAPDRGIDFVFVSRNADWQVRNVDVIAETVASDHRPVVAHLVLRLDAASRDRAAPCRRAA